MKVDYNSLPDDFFVSLLREKIRHNLKDVLMATAEGEVDKVVDAAVASLDVDIRRLRDAYDASELFGVRVERSKRD